MYTYMYNVYVYIFIYCLIKSNGRLGFSLGSHLCNDYLILYSSVPNECVHVHAKN